MRTALLDILMFCLRIILHHNPSLPFIPFTTSVYVSTYCIDSLYRLLVKCPMADAFPASICPCRMNHKRRIAAWLKPARKQGQQSCS